MLRFFLGVLQHGEERHNCSKVPTFQKFSALPMDRGNRFVRLNIRVYGQNMPVTHSHGFLVDDFPTGLSPPIGDIQVDVRKVNFESLRTTIEYNTGSHMNRRSLIFQEALFIMSRLPNLYDRPLIRPLTLYNGPEPRDWQPIEDR